MPAQIQISTTPQLVTKLLKEVSELVKQVPISAENRNLVRENWSQLYHTLVSDQELWKLVRRYIGGLPGSRDLAAIQQGWKDRCKMLEERFPGLKAGYCLEKNAEELITLVKLFDQFLPSAELLEKAALSPWYIFHALTPDNCFINKLDPGQARKYFRFRAKFIYPLPLIPLSILQALPFWNHFSISLRSEQEAVDLARSLITPVDVISPAILGCLMKSLEPEDDQVCLRVLWPEITKTTGDVLQDKKTCIVKSRIFLSAKDLYGIYYKLYVTPEEFDIDEIEMYVRAGLLVDVEPCLRKLANYHSVYPVIMFPEDLYWPNNLPTNCWKYADILKKKYEGKIKQENWSYHPKSIGVLSRRFRRAEEELGLPKSANPVSRKPKPVKPAAVKPAAVKPPAVKPPAVKPPAVKPPAVKPPAVKPPAVKPSAVKPAAVKPAAVKPAAVKPSAVKPSAVKPRAVKPPAVKPQAVKPSAVKPSAVNNKQFVNQFKSIYPKLSQEDKQEIKQFLQE